MANTTSVRLRKLMLILDIPNVQLAKALSIDPSLVSRWVNDGFGKRRAEEHALSVGRYIASRRWNRSATESLLGCLSISSTESLTPECVAAYLLPELYPSADESPMMLARFHEAVSPINRMENAEENHALLRRAPEIAILFRNELAEAESGSTVDVYLSSEQIACIADPDLLHVIREYSEKLDLKWRMLIQSANNSYMSGRIIGAYMPLLVQGRLVMNILQGTPQTFTANMCVMIPDRSAILVTEVIQKPDDLVAAAVRDKRTLEDLSTNFEDTLKYSRPLMSAYDDHFIQNIIELFAAEYCTPGSLDVVKSGMNPMYYTPEEYGRILHKLGMTGNEYNWRIDQFNQLITALGPMMAGSRSREVLSLSMLNKVIEAGKCRMPGMYFMTSGICYTDREDIAALLADYIRYLEEYPDFHIILLDDDSLFSPNSCWHIKSNKHITIHTWDIDSPILVVSDRMMIIDEFQRYFDSLWDKVAAGTTDRDTIRTLTELRDRCLALQAEEDGKKG